MFSRLRRHKIRVAPRPDSPRVRVLFARHNETFDEDFVGVALTREQEKAMGQHVDTDAVTCWTEYVALQGWNTELNEHSFPRLVYLVFRAGAAQGEERKEDSEDAEILGAFVSRADAEKEVRSLQEKYGVERIPAWQKAWGDYDFHIWELEFGWLPEELRHNGPPIPKYHLDNSTKSINGKNTHPPNSTSKSNRTSASLKQKKLKLKRILKSINPQLPTFPTRYTQSPGLPQRYSRQAKSAKKR